MCLRPPRLRPCVRRVRAPDRDGLCPRRRRPRRRRRASGGTREAADTVAHTVRHPCQGPLLQLPASTGARRCVTVCEWLGDGEFFGRNGVSIFTAVGISRKALEANPKEIGRVKMLFQTEEMLQRNSFLDGSALTPFATEISICQKSSGNESR